LDHSNIELTSILSAGLILGLSSSMHCLGMCGPLAYSAKTFRYHLGRFNGYLLLLVPLSFAGQGLRMISPYLAMAAGLFLGAILIQQGLNASGFNLRFKFQFSGKISHYLSVIFRKISHGAGPWRLGIASAFLPCGVLWSAMAGALALPHWQGALLAFSGFWLGTLPALVIGMPVATYLGSKLNNYAPKVYGLGLCILGIALITHRVSAAWFNNGSPSCH
jgi:sulfite exporter TauE/SafE